MKKLIIINKSEVESIKYKPDVDIIYTTSDKFYICEKNSITEFSDYQLQFFLAPKRNFGGDK